MLVALSRVAAVTTARSGERGPSAPSHLTMCFLGCGTSAVAELGPADMPEILAVMRKFADQDLQLADAALAHVAERDGYQSLIAIDERDFRAVEASRRGRLKLIVPSNPR